MTDSPASLEWVSPRFGHPMSYHVIFCPVGGFGESGRRYTSRCSCFLGNCTFCISICSKSVSASLGNWAGVLPCSDPLARVPFSSPSILPTLITNRACGHYGRREVGGMLVGVFISLVQRVFHTVFRLLVGRRWVGSSEGASSRLSGARSGTGGEPLVGPSRLSMRGDTYRA